MGTYLYQHEEWPRFRYEPRALLAPLTQVAEERGALFARLESLGFDHRQDAKQTAVEEEVLGTSAVEGEHFDPRHVRASIAWRLGIDAGGVPSGNHRLEGIVDVALDAAERWRDPLDAERLFRWHSALFPYGLGPFGRIRVADWRDDTHGPMLIVSGSMRKERVHYRAPDAANVPTMMAELLRWFESDAEPDAVLRAGIAHLWFETIHPFEDGNGRIGRAILDLALARNDRREWRCYSLSAQLWEERANYYAALERAQGGALDVTEWLVWYLGALARALQRASRAISGSLERGRFWARHAARDLNERQRRVLNRMLEGLEGKMSNEKWAKMARCSSETATRDLRELVTLGILIREGVGRGIRYALAPLDDENP